MVLAFLLANIEPKKERGVFEALLKDQRTSYVYAVFGSDDFIIRARADMADSLREYHEMVKKIPGVVSTTYLPVRKRFDSSST